MTRLFILVEGQTEERFVKEVLAPHLWGCGYTSVAARCFGNQRQRDHRGGIRSWISARRDILKHLKEDAACFVTTMVDYYGLPDSDGKEWPGRVSARGMAIHERASFVEEQIRLDLIRELDTPRFIPFVVMHEFEALLFSDCNVLAHSIGQPELDPILRAIRDQFFSPEEINDSPETAPSKRISALAPGYQKPIIGVDATTKMGLATIRSECPHFNHWITTLERLPTESDDP